MIKFCFDSYSLCHNLAKHKYHTKNNDQYNDKSYILKTNLVTNFVLYKQMTLCIKQLQK